jgi:undecaprenyl diphosphate synthase
MQIDAELDRALLPKHVAIVMDGNGRWAEKRKKPRLHGHRAGASSVREIVEVAAEIGIEILTLYAFSSENWRRPEQEVKGLMTILKNYLESELTRMLNNNIRLSCIGDLTKIPDGVRETLLKTIEKTQKNDRLILNLALSYGARDEITSAVQKIAQKCLDGKLQYQEIRQHTISEHLYTSDLIDPDLFIRTGGEKRLSNFLLWQASYAEIIFTDTMWPDYRKEAFLASLQEFQQRERRFGKTGAQLRTG